MGGRGTFAIGNIVPYSYKTIGKIGNVKILEKNNTFESKNLPEESHSSKAYILLDDNGVFRKYREYKNHVLQFEIEYGTHNSKKTLHYHQYINGVRQRMEEIPENVKKKYKKYFKGLNL